MKCIHQPNRLSVIPSELAPLLDVIPVGVEVQTDEVLDQPRCAHALSSEEADNPVQFVTHLLADEHGLAVDNLGDLEIGARYSSSDSLRCLQLTRFCGIAISPTASLDGSSAIAVSVSSVTVLPGCSGSSGSRPIRL